MAAHVQRMQRYGTGVTRPNMALEREALAQMLAAAQRSDALASATMGLVATLQATVGDGKDAAIIDAAVNDVSAALAEQATPTDTAAEADALLAAAGVQLDAVESDPAAKSELQGGPAAAPAPAASRVLAVHADRVEKAKAIVNAATSAATGNWGGVVSSAAALLPEGSSLHYAMAGAGAIMSGDYLGAVEAATKLARSRPRLAIAMDRLRERLKGAAASRRRAHRVANRAPHRASRPRSRRAGTGIAPNSWSVIRSTAHFKNDRSSASSMLADDVLTAVPASTLVDR